MKAVEWSFERVHQRGWGRLRPAVMQALLVLSSILACGAARAGDPKVDAMAETFVANLPLDWQVKVGGWQYFDVPACFVSGGPCFGNNPSSAYSYPIFPGGAQLMFDPSEALVIFLRTPPEVRYFAFTQYLSSRGIQSSPVLASLGKSLNLLQFVTIGTGTPGQDVFDHYAVVVWTADLNTLASVKATLAKQGIRAAQVNFIPLPIQLPLNMGYSADADVFALLMRAALPKAQADFDAYRAEIPFGVLKVGPLRPPPLKPAPTVGYPSSISGIVESPTANSTLDSLVADIKAHYRNDFLFKDQAVKLYLETGFECIAGTETCTMDNYDALYSTDLTAPVVIFRKLQDVVIIAGVNHRLSGKALYSNHAVQDPATKTGIVTVDDPLFTLQSALYHAGVRQYSDPRTQLYKGLYAYAIAYDCNGLKYCLNIPAPTTGNPVGLPPGAPFNLLARDYVEPHSAVRPDETETIRQRVLLGMRR